MHDHEMMTKAPEGETREEFEARVTNEVMAFAEAVFYPSEVLLPGDAEPTEVPFHNFPHARGVYDKAMEYCDYLEANGKKVDRFAVGLAAILHDARYIDDLDKASESLKSWGVIKKKLKSKEQYSAVLAGILLHDLGVEEQTIKKVQKLIRTTNKDAKPKTLEEKVLVRSDLDNIKGRFKTFIKGTEKLVKEANILNRYHGKPNKDSVEIMIFLRDILKQYTVNDLCFGDFDRDFYDKVFRNPAAANIARLGATITIIKLGSKEEN